MHLLRVNSRNDIVVPPFECAWLSDEHLQLENGKGCIQFEVKGEPSANSTSPVHPALWARLQ